MTTMTLSTETTAILKNFASINQSIWFKAGTQIRTRSQSREVYAFADLKEQIPTDFAVYDLPRLLNVCGLFSEQPEFKFGTMDNGVLIGNGKSSVRYIFSDPIIVPDYCVRPEEYDKNPKMPAIISTFNLKHEQLGRIIKAASVLNSPNISITSDGTSVKLIAHDKKNSLCDKFELELDGATTDKPFNVELKLETLRLIPGDYMVDVGEKIAVRFTNQTTPVTYFICAQIAV